MVTAASTLQRITILAPVSEILSQIEASVSPVAATIAVPDAAVGLVLAADVIAPASLPPYAIALQDGWAVSSEAVTDASAYAPAVLTPAPDWLHAGQALPRSADAVLAPDAASIANGYAEIHTSAAQGEAVLAAEGHFAKGATVCRAGDRLRAIDCAILSALNVNKISVHAPRIKVVSATTVESGEDVISPFIASIVRTRGGIPEFVRGAHVEAVFSGPDADAVIVVGGSGMGRNDSSVHSLARFGRVDFHGIAISPGQTAAFGGIGACPVLVLPGRVDAALAAFLSVGDALMARLTGARTPTPGTHARLAKKVTSTIGLSEIIFVRHTDDGVEPLGTGFFPLQALARASGWILVPPASEGLAAGATVEVRELP
jgi:molybdopterin molybdotransferase